MSEQVKMSEPILDIVLPVELRNNNTGRGNAFWKSAKERKEIEATLRIKYAREPFEFPVVVHVTRLLRKGQRLWDSSSVLRGNYKELEDSLVALGWFHDDSPGFIVHTAGFQDPIRRENAETRIQIYREPLTL